MSKSLVRTTCLPCSNKIRQFPARFGKWHSGQVGLAYPWRRVRNFLFWVFMNSNKPCWTCYALSKLSLLNIKKMLCQNFCWIIVLMQWAHTSDTHFTGVGIPGAIHLQSMTTHWNRPDNQRLSCFLRIIKWSENVMSTKQKRNRPLWHHGIDMITMSGNGMDVHTHTRGERVRCRDECVCGIVWEKERDGETDWERNCVCCVC